MRAAETGQQVDNREDIHDRHRRPARRREILDSRGNPTVEVDVTLEDRAPGRAAVPSGASTGAHEAVELRDGDERSRFGGKGVLEGPRQQSTTRDLRDDRRGPRRRGPGGDRRGDDRAGRARPTRPISAPTPFSACRSPSPGLRRRAPACRSTVTSAASPRGVLPTPMMNIVNGGVHADNPIDFQEFVVVPVGAPSLSEAVRWGSEVFQVLKGGPQEGGAQHQRRRRGRLRAQPAVGRGPPSISA